MAKIQLTDLLTDIRGSVGGITYTKGVGGIHIRKTKPIPSVSSTVRQTFVRTLLPFLAGLWRELTDDQRSIWATFAGTHPIPDVFGVPRIYPAYNYFIKLNYVHGELDLPWVLDAPLDQELPISPSGRIVLTPVAGGFMMIFSLEASENYTLDIWKFGPASAGRHPQVGDVRHLSYVDPSSAGIPRVYTCANGRITLYARFVDPTTGLLSPFINLGPVDVTT